MTASIDLVNSLRQMVAVLQTERQALAGLDLDMIMGCANNKSTLCEKLESFQHAAVDEECRGLLESAHRLNEVNRQMRNLIAANVSARLDALTGTPSVYRTQSASPVAYAGARL